MAPWARVVAQVLLGAGNMFFRAFAQAYQQASQQGARGGAMKETTNKILGRMSRQEALKILNLENEKLTPQLITQSFERIFKANSLDQKDKGSYYIQCKAEHAKNSLHEYYFSEEYQNILKEQESTNNENTQNSTNDNDNNETKTNTNTKNENNRNNENDNDNSNNNNNNNNRHQAHAAALPFFGSFIIVASMNMSNEESEENRICFY